MNFPDIPKLATGGLTAAAVTMGGMPGALAHWGHLGEVAGHGHMVGAALGVAAAGLAAALLARGRNQTTDDEDNAETDREINTGDEGDLADA